MWKTFNSKIFAVAIIPFSLYVVISVFVFINAGYRLEVFNPISVIVLSVGTFTAAICYSVKNRKLHILALLIMLVLGGIGIYIGFSVSLNWIELICSACIIAFGIAMFEMVDHRHQDA